jgi:hypothetical protein
VSERRIVVSAPFTMFICNFLPSPPGFPQHETHNFPGLGAFIVQLTTGHSLGDEFHSPSFMIKKILKLFLMRRDQEVETDNGRLITGEIKYSLAPSSPHVTFA